MSDVRITYPRRAGAAIYLHAADITQIMLQDDVLHAFTDDELQKIANAVNIERQERDPQPERTNAPDTAQPE